MAANGPYLRILIQSIETSRLVDEFLLPVLCRIAVLQLMAVLTRVTVGIAIALLDRRVVERQELHLVEQHAVNVLVVRLPVVSLGSGGVRSRWHS